MSTIRVNSRKVKIKIKINPLFYVKYEFPHLKSFHNEVDLIQAGSCPPIAALQKDFLCERELIAVSMQVVESCAVPGSAYYRI